MNFIKAIESAWKKNNSLVCVGLDPDISKIPALLQGLENPLFEFNRAIVDATSDLVCAFKPQMAFYSAAQAEQDLFLTIEHIHKNHPGIPVILDAKRGDIGSTAEMYAKEVFDRYQADAVTVNPYMGGDTLQPFLKRRDKGVIILCRTSNPGSRDNILLVVGATFLEELKEIRAIVGEMPLLVPGIGAQGGDVARAVTNGKTQNGTGMIINSSRGIIYSSQGDDFAEAARNAAKTLRVEINQYR
jgi:orotidine-5'-phosphate decarboxylase